MYLIPSTNFVKFSANSHHAQYWSTVLQFPTLWGFGLPSKSRFKSHRNKFRRLIHIRTFQTRANYPELTTLVTEFSHLETLTVQRYSFTADKRITDTELHLFSDVYSKALAIEYNIRKKSVMVGYS